MEREITIIGDFKYRLSNTGFSSAKFGKCEVCGSHCSEVFVQAELRRYEMGWTHYDTEGTHLATKRVF